MPDAVSKSAETLTGRLDRLPWTPLHTRITLALGVGWLLDSFEVNVIGNVLGVLQRLWHLTNLEASTLVTVWLLGIMIGALLFGYLADRFGRRRLFVLTLLLYSTFTVVSALSPGYWAFLVFRFLTAIGVGAEYSAVNAAIGELIPAKYRGRASATVMNFWPLGSILAAAVSLYFLNLLPPAIGWRLAFGLGAIIALFTIWVRTALPESPRWLLGRGRQVDAARVVEQMEAQAGSFAALPSGAAAADDAPGFFGQVRTLMRDHPGRLAFGALLDFSEAAGYYGIFAFLPLVVLPAVHVREQDVPWFFLIGNVGAVIGGLLAAWLLDRAGRKVTVTGFYGLAAVSMLVMGVATLSGSAQAVLWAFIVANLCATGSWIAAYPTFSEIFPTALRSTGIGCSVAFGRIGAAIAPPLLVALASRVSVMTAFAVLAAFWALGALVMLPWCLWGPEGRGRPLELLATDRPLPATAVRRG
ncbi:MAG TPA: MFS transporter [Vicinamibacterales bacterium]|nr:MFS transporter [Vicinamibacterales bacterium]